MTISSSTCDNVEVCDDAMDISSSTCDCDEVLTSSSSVTASSSSSVIAPRDKPRNVQTPCRKSRTVMSYCSDKSLCTLPRIQIQLGPKTYSALVDTGAEYSSISSVVMEDLMAMPSVAYKKASFMRLIGVGNKAVKVNWEAQVLPNRLTVLFDNEWLFDNEDNRPKSYKLNARTSFAVVDSGFDMILGLPEIGNLKIFSRLSQALKCLGQTKRSSGKKKHMMNVTSLGRAWKFAQYLDHTVETRSLGQGSDQVSLSSLCVPDVNRDDVDDMSDDEDPDGSDYVPPEHAQWGVPEVDRVVDQRWTHSDECREVWGELGRYRFLAATKGFVTLGGRESSKPSRGPTFKPSRSGTSSHRSWNNRNASYNVFPYHPVDNDPVVAPTIDEYVCNNNSVANGDVSSAKDLLGELPDEDDEFADISSFLDVDYSGNVQPSIKGKFSERAIKAFAKLWVERAKVFATELPKSGAKVDPLQIGTYTGAKPVAMSPRRFSKPILDLIDIEIKKLLGGNVIVESTSDYSAEIVMVKQKGKFRMCIDYSQVNKTLVGMKHPIPNIRELLDNLAGHKFFGKLDLRSGYHQFPLDEASRKFTAFRVGNKLYEFTRIPFGLKMAPAYFQMIMQQLLASHIGRTCYVYLDDIIIFGDTEEQFQVNLDGILRRLEESEVVLRGEKCVMATAASSLEILGYQLNDIGITLSMEKKQGLLDMQRPTSQTNLRSFNGLANYFRPFIDNFANIIKPLTAASGKELQEWTAEMDGAFTAVKLAVQALEMLYYIDDEQPLFLRTDASNIGAGGILFQRFIDGDVVEEKPIAFVSKAFNDTEKNWSTIEQEGFAIFHCVMKLDHYLKGRFFTIETDHRNLVYMANSLTPKVIRWRLRLLEFDFDVEHIAGEDNVVADALSRCLSTKTLNMTEHGGVTVNLGKVAPKYQMSDVHRQVIASIHNPVIGHFSVDRTIKLLEALGHDWDDRHSDVTAFIKGCGKCQKTKKGNGTLEESYRSTMTDLPFAKTAIDTIGPLPPDEFGNCYILVAIDCFTRVVELKASKSTSAVEAASFLLEIFGRYGPPRVIHSDNGPQYAAQVVVEFIRMFESEKSTTLPYRPQANGICERVNGEVMRHLTALTMDSPEVKMRWSVSLPIVARIVNYSYHSAIGTYPAKLLYGMNTNGTGVLLDGISLPKPVNPSQKDGFDYLKDLMVVQKAVITAAQAFQKALIKDRVDKIPEAHRRECTIFRAGDFVLASYPERKPDKLTPTWRGPFIVIDKIKANTYKVQHLNEKSRVEVLHVSRLIPYDSSLSDPELVATMDDSSNTIDFIVEHLPKGPFGKGKRNKQFKVRWQGFGPEEDLWIPYSEMADTEALDRYMEENGLFFK